MGPDSDLSLGEDGLPLLGGPIVHVLSLPVEQRAGRALLRAKPKDGDAVAPGLRAVEVREETKQALPARGRLEQRAPPRPLRAPPRPAARRPHTRTAPARR